jgi:membrane protease YdiL (CAAX protease family)
VSRPPSTARALRLLVLVSLRRFYNRVLYNLLARKREPDAKGAPGAQPKRGPTQPKRAGGTVALAFIALMLVFQSLRAASNLVVHVRNYLLPPAARDDLVAFGPSVDLWPQAAHLPIALRILGAVMLVFGLSVVTTSLSAAKDDLGRVEWTMEWLYQLPVSSRALHLAKLAEHAVVRPMIWVVGMPAWFAFAWCAGLGWWSLVIALVLTLQVAFVSGALHITIETWLRLNLSAARVKNAQALFTVMGVLLLLVVVTIGVRIELPAAAFAKLALAPRWLAYNPFSVGVLAITGDVPAMVLVFGYALAIPWAAVAVCDRLVLPGLVVAGATYQGARRGDGARAWAKGLFEGVIAKDARLLFRDRNLLTQTLIMPLVLFAFQLAVNPLLLASILSTFRHAVAIGFFAGTYGFAASAFNILGVEGRALWLLYTFPRPLHRVLGSKIALWSTFGLVFVVGLSAFGLVRAPASAQWPIDAATAIIGTVIYAFIAAGLGCLATDPLATVPNRRANPLFVYLYLLLIGLYARALYADSVWLKVVQLVLSLLLAIALWQKVRDRIPYLLDPTEAPPPSVDVGDGLVAVLAFFVLQGLVATAARATGDVSPSVATVIAFATAGFLVSAVTLFVFWRVKVPNVLHAVGLRRHRGEGKPSWLAAPMGLAAGATAAVVAAAYLIALSRAPVLQQLRDATDSPMPRIERGALVLVAVIAAPLFEELIFRGLIFKALRRTWSPWASILASAAIFAICHPPLAVVPVFGLGVAAAWVFERTRHIAAPIAAHMAYNGLVIAVGLGAR